MELWRFIDSGPSPGSENMRLDEELAVRFLEGSGAPTLRVFQWNPWAISLGHYQRIEEIDVDRCSANGIDVVRRPTGGRAILHAEELTYSIVMNSGGKNVTEVYNNIGRALLEGLRLFGVEANLQRAQPDFVQRYRRPSSIPCFSSSARYEIEWGGRKLVGSAQRRYMNNHRTVILQHGSILCGPAHLRLAEYIRGDGQEFRDEIRRDLLERTVCLQEILGGRVDVNLLARSLKQGFETSWGISFNNADTHLQRRTAHG